MGKTEIEKVKIPSKLAGKIIYCSRLTNPPALPDNSHTSIVTSLEN